MSRYTQATKQIGDVWVDAFKRGEELMTSAAKTRRTQPRTTRRAGLLQELPTLHEVVEANYELVERVLKAQKHYALKAIEAAFPDTAGPARRAAHHEPARKPAPARRKRATARTRRRTTRTVAA